MAMATTERALLDDSLEARQAAFHVWVATVRNPAREHSEACFVVSFGHCLHNRSEDVLSATDKDPFHRGRFREVQLVGVVQNEEVARLNGTAHQFT